ncbi:hypothetical protein [Peredibacter starrii]|uniref:DUF4403 family protein n=1 Tax=Peredibacter starrii TaxID=28202 RepID=A0AAX4HUF0_9BACT|nr:hypothetical protein [Peredibacter starrii]WPU66579.1 hypothetical protein SOO65_07460 [Peredibacter starrii]
MKYIVFALFFSSFLHAQTLFETKVASIFVSEAFVNEQLAGHLSKSDLVQNLKMKLEPVTGKMLLQGDFQLPLDDMRAIGIERDLARFKFQLSILPKISQHKHLILEFPLSETYFYQANSKNPKRDRVVIPVQLLSLGLAATRGYLAALSGDFSTFDRKIAKYKALLKVANKSIVTEKNPDALEVLKSGKKSLELQIASVELERDNFKRTSKALNSIFAFSSEKDFNLNNEIQANGNTLMLKLKLSKLVPYLKDIELGGIRVGNNNPDNSGENFLIFDINTMVTEAPPAVKKTARKPINYKIPPSLMIRLSQDLFTSKLMLEKEKEKIGDSIKDFKIRFKNGGIHISGKVSKLFWDVPFEGLVDFISTGPDVFEVRLRQLEVMNLDLKFLTPVVLTAVKSRLKKGLSGIATYKYLGNKDHSRVLQVTIEPKKLIPAFPDFHLVGVDVRDRNFMLKLGRIQ